MALANINLKFGVNLADFAKNLESAQGKVNKFGKSMEKIGKALSLKVTLPLVALGGAATKLNMDFDDSMRKVMATTNASAADFDKLKEKAKEMGAQTRYSASESAEAMNYMALAGWKTEQIIAGIPSVLNLAAASGEDLAMVSDIVTDGLTAFGKSAEYSNRFTDILAATAANANTNIGMLGEAFKYIGPAAGALGFSVEDTAQALGLMANAGIKASQGGTALRTIISGLVNPTSQSQKAMDALGISVANADGTIKPLGEIMDVLRDRFAALTPEQQAVYAGMIAGREGMSGLLTIVNAAEEDFTKLGSALENADGTAQRMSEQMEGGLGGAMRSLRSATEGLMIEFGEILAPVMMKVAEVTQSVVRWFSGLSDTTKTVMVVIGGLAAAVGPLLTGIGFMATTVLPMVTMGFKALAVVMSPLTLKIAAITAAVGILALSVKGIYDSWSTISAFFQRMWTNVKLLFIEGVASALKSFNKFTSIIGLDFSETVKGMEDEAMKLNNTLQMTPEVKIGDVFSEIGKNVRETFTSVKDTVSSSMSQSREELGKTAVDAQALKNVLAGLGGQPNGGEAVYKSGKVDTPAIEGGEAKISLLPEINTDAFKEKLSSIGLSVREAGTYINEEMLAFQQSAGSIISGGITDTFIGLGEAIGSSFAAGSSIFQAAGQALLGGLSGIMSQLGKLMIEYGTLAIVKAKLDASMAIPGAGFVTGPMAIAAGIAMVAASAAIGSLASGRSGGGSSGGGELGAAVGISGARAMGGTVMANKSYLVGERGPEIFTPSGHGGITPNKQLGGGDMTIYLKGEFVQRGSDMVAVIDQAVRVKGRTT